MAVLVVDLKDKWGKKKQWVETGDVVQEA